MMAAKESSSGGINREELDDITTCCICTEVYTDPKALPCIHTFCMKCIQETGFKTNKGPGDEMPCPICRRQFKIPAEGFRGLPKNFFIERLILLSKVSDSCGVVKELCSLCLEESEEQQGKEAPTADSFCVDCNFKLCEECCSEHRKFKLTKNHKLIPINEHRVDQNAMTELIQSVCEMHEQQDLNVYCADCKAVVCAVCFIEAHDNHKGSHVDRCLDGFRRQIEDNTEAINECIAKAHVRKAEIVKVKEEMHQRVEHLEDDVERRKEEIKQLTDEHSTCLLQSLSSERQVRLKEIQMVTDDIDAYLSNLESYNFYCQRLMDKGSSIDICRAISDLAIRALELQQQCQPMIERRIMNFKYCFRQSSLQNLLQEDSGNLVGEIAEESDLKPRKRGRQNLSSEESNETRLRNTELEIERTNKESLRLGNDLLKEQQINKKVKQELSDAKAYYDTQIARLKQELENNEIENKDLQTSNDKLKQELDAEKIKNNSLRINNDKLVDELNFYKATVMSLEINAEKVRKEPDASKADDLQGKYSPTPVLVHTIGRKSGRKKKLHFPTRIKASAAAEEKKSIRGLTILDKELFVVSELSSDVEVYDSIKLSISRRWNLKELIRPMDIGSCKRNKCLYIFDCKGHLHSNDILRVDPNGKLIRNWSTGVELGYGLSVTAESNVVLTDYNKNRLNEYSPDGQLIREINLSNAGIHWPWHAIKLTNGNFVVSHGSIVDDLHRVCIVDIDGKFKNSFGGSCGSEIGHMNRPVHLSFDGHGSVIVVDQMNSRVLLLDPDLEFKKEILSKEKHGLRDPWRILLDESNGRLFVADNESDNQRIMTFDFK